MFVTLQPISDGSAWDTYVLGSIGDVAEGGPFREAFEVVAPGEPPIGTKLSGGATILKKDINGEWQTQVILMTDGTDFPGMSSATRIHNTYVLGSWVAKGVYICSKNKSLRY